MRRTVHRPGGEMPAPTDPAGAERAVCHCSRAVFRRRYRRSVLIGRALLKSSGTRLTSLQPQQRHAAQVSRSLSINERDTLKGEDAEARVFPARLGAGSSR